MTLADAAARPTRSRRTATSASSRSCARSGTRSSRAAARAPDFRERAVAYRAIGQFRFRTKIELLRRGLDDDSPAVRGSALLALEKLSRDHPGVVNDVRPLLHELLTNDGNEAVRRLGVVALKNGSARPGHDSDPRVARRRRRAAARAARSGGEGRAAPAAQGQSSSLRLDAAAAVVTAARRAGGPLALQLKRVLCEPGPHHQPRRARRQGHQQFHVRIDRTVFLRGLRRAWGCAWKYNSRRRRRLRGCRARSSRGRHGRASPEPSAGRRRPRAGAWRTSGGAGGGARAAGRARPSRPACAGSGRRRPGSSGPPRAFRKSSGRWRASRYGRPRAR